MRPTSGPWREMRRAEQAERQEAWLEAYSRSLWTGEPVE